MQSLIRNRNRLIGAAIAIAALMVAGCAAPRPRVHSDFNRATDFAAYRTFGFPPQTGTDRGGYATLVTTYFKDALKREMSARGYSFAEMQPDLLVNFYSETSEKTEVYGYPSFGTEFGWGLHRGRPRYGFYSAWPFYSDVDAVQYTSGKIKVDVIDAKLQQTVWEATAEERLSDQAQDNPQPNIARLIEEIFRKFPRTTSNTP